MKTLTAIAEQERKKTSKNAFWLFDLELPDQVMRFASRPLKLGELLYEPGLMNMRTFSLDVPEGEFRGISQVVLDLVNLASSEIKRLQFLDVLSGVEGTTGTVSVFLKDPMGISGVDDVIVLGEFLVSGAEFSPSMARLFLLDPLTYHSQKKLCRRADSRLLSGLKPDDEFYFPVIFGKIEKHAPLLLPLVSASGWKTRISGDLEPEAVFASLEDVSPLPERGRAQIGDEVMEYRCVDRDNATIGSIGSPLIRPEAGFHADGTAVRFLPEGGIRYLVADHPCKSVTSVSANGRLLNEGEFEILTQDLGGREVCEIRLERYPCLVQRASGISVLRMDGSRSPGCFIVKEGGSALFPERAIDAFPGVTAARLNNAGRDLILQFDADLANGDRKYGKLVRCFIEVCYLSSPKEGNRAPLLLEAGKGANKESRKIFWRENQTLKGMIQRRELLVYGVLDKSGVPALSFPENSLHVGFDEVLGEVNLGGGNFKWKDSHFSKDDDFSFYTVNFSGENSDANDQPLEFRIRRRPMMDAACKPARVIFHAIMDSAGTPAKNVKLDMRLADRFNGAASFYVDGQKKEYAYDVPVQDINFEHIVDSETYFAIRVPDGSALRVYEAWLEIGYILNPPEIDPEKTMNLKEMEGELSGVEVSLPSPVTRHWMDITSLVKANGDWGFFSKDEVSPVIAISFAGGEETVHITNVSLLAEYRPRVHEIQTSDLSADVEGIHESGELTQNPADVVRCVLTHRNFLDFSESKVDDISFENVRNYLSNLNQIHQGRYTGSISMGGALDHVMRDSGTRLVRDGGKFRMLLPSWNPGRIGESVETIENIDEKSLLDPEPFVKKDAGSLTQSVETLVPLDMIRLERGDRVSLSHERGLLNRAWGEIASWKIQTLDQIRMKLAPLETGVIFWEHDNYTLLRQLCGGKGIAFFINKTAVARLERSGDLYLMNELWEGSLQEQGMSSLIEFDEEGSRVLFGAGAEGDYASVFALDGQGRLFTRGEVVEGFLPFSVAPGDFASSLSIEDEDYIVLSADSRTPLLIGERSTGRIYLKKEVKEDVNR